MAYGQFDQTIQLKAVVRLPSTLRDSSTLRDLVPCRSWRHGSANFVRQRIETIIWPAGQVMFLLAHQVITLNTDLGAQHVTTPRSVLNVQHDLRPHCNFPS